jgi:tetratricopeptide (TPR) repeat protein
MLRRNWKMLLSIALTLFFVFASVAWFILDRTLIPIWLVKQGDEAAERHEYEVAEARYTSALRKYPSDSPRRPYVLGGRARARYRLGKDAEGLQDAETAFKENPTNWFALTWQGIGKYKLGRYQEAETDLKLAVSKHDFSTIGHFDLGMSLERRGALSEAVASYSKAIETNAKHARSYASLYRVQFAAGKNDEAHKWYEKAIAIDPNVHFEIE